MDKDLYYLLNIMTFAIIIGILTYYIAKLHNQIEKYKYHHNKINRQIDQIMINDQVVSEFIKIVEKKSNENSKIQKEIGFDFNTYFCIGKYMRENHELLLSIKDKVHD